MEWRKISKKTILIILGIFCAQAFLFLYSVNMKEKETDDYLRDSELEYNEEYILKQEEYVEGYHGYIEKIIKQADSLGGVSIFSKIDSFSESNLNVTKKDYEKVLEVEPVAFNDIFIKQYFKYTSVNGFVLLAGVFVVFSLLDSKKNNMRVVLYSSKNGRDRLIISKIATLFICDFIISVIFYTGNLFISATHFGGFSLKCLSYPIQSVSTFVELPYVISIDEFLAIYILHKTIIMFSITMIVWLIMYLIDNIIMSLGVIGLLGGIMFVLYSVIDANHKMNYFRYCNLWYMMKDESVFSEYKNLNWQESAVNKNVFIGMTIIVILLVTISCSIWAGVKKYPIICRGDKRILNTHIINRIRTFLVEFSERLPISGFEYYKIFIKQKGIIVVIVLLYVVISQVDLQEINRSKAQLMYYEFMEKYEGVQSEDSENFIEELDIEMEKLNKEYEECILAYDNGEISVEEWFIMDEKYRAFESERDLLNELKAQQEHLNTIKSEDNVDGWYVNVYGYNHLFAVEDTLGNIGLIFAIVLICSGLFAYEKLNGTVYIVRGSSGGRKKVFAYKLQVAVLSALLLFLTITGIEILLIDHLYGLSGFAAPIQSLYTLDFIPFECNIGTFIFIMYTLKGLVILSLSAIVCMVSMSASKKQIITVLIVLCIPALLTSIGFVGFENYSIISVMSIGPMMIRIGSIIPALCTSIVFGIVAVVSIIKGYKKWCIT